jgi:hypothetical protein
MFMRQPLLLLFVLLVYTGATAQLVNSGILYIGTGSTLYTGGDFTNTAAANYTNDGAVTITGNTVNSQAALPAGAGTTFFNGATAQTLGGGAPFRSFHVILNDAAGLVLSNRLAIGDGTSGSLTFTAGRITAGSALEDVYFYPGSSYSGFDDSHHIIGYTTKSGNTNFTFPIGDGVHAADLDLTGLTVAGDFQVLYTGGGYGIYNTNASLPASGVFDKEWWNILETAGAAQAHVTLKWNDARKQLNHSEPAGLVVANFTGGAWQSAGGTSSTPAGSATGIVGPSNLQTGFGPFTFGSVSVPLPIVLSSFTATDENCQAYLAWTTQIEENAAGFDVQQSLDGINYITVAFVAANGIPSNYHITIAQQAIQALYRIRLVDLDGSSVYSVVTTLQLTCLAASSNLSAYPNPFTTGTLEVKLTVPQTKGEAQLQVFDLSGRKIAGAGIQVNSGTNLYTIPTGEWAQGVYTLIIIGDGWKTQGISIIKKAP